MSPRAGRLTSPCSRRAGARRDPRRERPGPRPAAEGQLVRRARRVAVLAVATVLLSVAGCRSSESLAFASLSEATVRSLASEAQVVAAEVTASTPDTVFVTRDRKGDTEWYLEFERGTGKLIQATLQERGTSSIRDFGDTDLGQFLFAPDGTLWCYRCFRFQGTSQPFGIVGLVYFFAPNGVVANHLAITTVQQVQLPVCATSVSQWSVPWPTGFPPVPSPR